MTNQHLVGRLKNLVMFDRLEEEFMWDGGEEIKPKYIGGDKTKIRKSRTVV